MLIKIYPQPWWVYVNPQSYSMKIPLLRLKPDNIWIWYNSPIMFYHFFLLTPLVPQGHVGSSGEVLKVGSELSHERIEEMIQESVAQLGSSGGLRIVFFLAT